MSEACQDDVRSVFRRKANRLRSFRSMLHKRNRFVIHGGSAEVAE